MDDLLSSLGHARSQCQEQARESSLGLIALDRFKLAERRFDHFAGTGKSLPRFQGLRLPSDEFRQIVAKFCCTRTDTQLAQLLSQVLRRPVAFSQKR